MLGRCYQVLSIDVVRSMLTDLRDENLLLDELVALLSDTFMALFRRASVAFFVGLLSVVRHYYAGSSFYNFHCYVEEVPYSADWWFQD